MPNRVNDRALRFFRHPATRFVAQPEQPSLIRYGAAAVLVGLALLLMLLLNPFVSMQNSPFLLFFAAVMASAWYGGLGPGVLALVLAILSSSYFFIPPIHSFAIANSGDTIRLVLFTLVSLLVTALSAVRQQLIRALRKERDLVSAIVSTAGSLIIVLDRQGRIVQFNRACERVTGYSLNEIRGKHVWDFFVPANETKFVQGVFQKLLAGVYPYEYEGDWLTRDGNRRLITWSNTVLFDDKGSVSYIISTGIDLTDRKQAERTLQETNQMLEALVQASPLSITVLNREGRVKLWNPAAERIFGWSADEAIGQIMPSVPLEKQLEFQANIAAIFRGDFQNGLEVRRQRKDGSSVFISLWAAVLRGLSSDDDCLLSVVDDITDRKQAEAALKLSQERLTSFVEANIIGILFGTVDGAIHEANDELLRMIGYSRDDLCAGKLDLTKMTPAEYFPLDQQRIIEAKERGACTPYEKEYLHQNGSRVPVLVGYTLLGEDREQSVAFILDLTDRKRLEQTLRCQAEELAQANRMKDEFLAVLSHELRTPLNSILGWSRLLRSRQLDATTTGRALETIERNARLQTQLIEDILDVSNMIRGKLRLQIRSIELAPIIEAAIDAMRPAADAKGVQLEFWLDPSGNRISGDPDRLQQVFWNLLSNAIKFTPTGGQVTVTLSEAKNWTDGMKDWTEAGRRWESKARENGMALTSPQPLAPRSSLRYAQVQVTDTGKGIRSDFLPFVFDRFRQADSTSTRTEGGLGLGLAIVRHLVELHGGDIQAESSGIGQGATFTVKLPLIGNSTGD